MDSVKIFSIILRRCNFSCGHCSSRSDNKAKGKISTEEVLGYLQGFEDFSKKSHLVSGGEPTLHEGLRTILDSSLEMGYKTNVVTNGWWLRPQDPDWSAQYFEKTFPEGVWISTSYDEHHLIDAPDMLERVELLTELARGRNEISVDGAYNGADERQRLETALEGFKYRLVPLQGMGKGADIVNCNPVLDVERVRCPKGSRTGFVAVESGTYYCLRSAMNANQEFRLTEGFDPEHIRAALGTHSQQDIDGRIERTFLQASPVQKQYFKHPCDVCESGCGPEQTSSLKVVY